MSTLSVTLHKDRGRQSRKRLREEPPEAVSPRRVPRVAKLMALAIRFEQLLRDGVVANQAELARLGRDGEQIRERVVLDVFE